MCFLTFPLFHPSLFFLHSYVLLLPALLLLPLLQQYMVGGEMLLLKIG